MGRDPNERAEREGPKGPSKAAQKKDKFRGRLKSVHLTEADKEALRVGDMTLDDALDTLEDYLSQGYKVTLTRTGEGGGLAVTIREVTADWQDARALSGFNSSLQRAILTLAWGLRGTWSSWPENGPAEGIHQNDW